jgi:hypothetical protein
MLAEEAGTGSGAGKMGNTSSRRRSIVSGKSISILERRKYDVAGF